MRLALALSFSAAFSLVSASVWARGEARVGLRKGPFAQGIDTTGATIKVEFDAPVTARLSFEPDAGAPKVVDSATPRDFHAFPVTGLEPAHTYRYKVQVLGEAIATGQFTTAPARDSNGPFSFLIYGDNRSDDAGHAAVVRAMAASPGDFLIHTGDFVADGGHADEWQRFFDIESKLVRERCLFAAIGNHELTDREATYFSRYFAPPARENEKPVLYGTMRWGMARFFFLNFMIDRERAEERAWFERELTKADAEPGVLWRIVVIHHGPWSSGPHGSNTRLLGAGIAPLLRNHHVDLVVSGHDHIYERGFFDGIRYVVSGGGGAPVYPIEQRAPGSRVAEPVRHFVMAQVTSDSVSLTAKRVDGATLDQCGFTKASGWTCDTAIAQPPESGRAVPTPPAGRCNCNVPGWRANESGAALVALAGLIALRRRRGTNVRGDRTAVA